MAGDRNGPTFYYDWIDQIEQLPEEYRWPIVSAILYYDRDGEKKVFDNPFLNIIADQYYVQIDNQQAKWSAAAKRPAKYEMDLFLPLFVEGWSNKEIAAKIGCSDRTVQRRRLEWEKLQESDN